MATNVMPDGSVFVPIRSGATCPVCGSKKGRCAEFYNSKGKKVFYRCKNKKSHRPSGGWYIHLVKEVDGVDPYQEESGATRFIPKLLVETEVTEEILDLRDKVYRRFRELVNHYEGTYLYDDDIKNLKKRGLTEKQIQRMGFFSVPTSEKTVLSDCGEYQQKVSTAISKKLFNEFGNDLLKVPGFVKRGKKGGEYIAFKGTVKNPQTAKFEPIKGFFIPYHDHKSRLVGMQYRLTTLLVDKKGKEVRYLWYSSSQARSGSPIDFYVPESPRREDVLLVTEGALKLKIACEALKLKGAGMAGVHNYNNLIKSLKQLESVTGFKYKIVLAFDMDKYELRCNGQSDVLKAERKTIALLKENGFDVAVAEWDGNKAKGIDDALKQKGIKIDYQLR